MAVPLDEGLALQNHVFVDFENVRNVDVSIFDRKPVSLTLLLGSEQKNLEAAIVEVLLRNAAAVQLVRIEFKGRNAVDFALAYYLGRAVLADPLGYFHIVSKDTGFDPLVKHLRSRHIRVRRHDDFSSLTFSAPRKAIVAVPEDPVSKLSELLHKKAVNRPKTKKKLSNMVANHCRGLSESEIDSLMQKLLAKCHLSISEKGALTYKD